MPRRNRLSRLKSFALLTVLLTAVAACQSPAGERPQLPLKPASGAPLSVVLEEADKALAQGLFEDATILIGRALKKDPNNARARLILAEVYLATGRTAFASATFKEVASSADVRAKALQGWGITLLKERKLEAGHKVLQEAVKEDPTLWRAWNALGLFYDSQRRWDEARESYAKALEAEPDSAVVHNNLGYSLLIQRKYSEAASEFTAALKLRPGLRVARTNLRVALAWQGRYEEAARGAGHKELPTVLNDVGYIAMLRGDLVAAEAYLVRAMEASPAFNETASRNLRDVKNRKNKKDRNGSAAQ